MSCSRASEIDLEAFLVDRASDQWATFRDHYPRCADCSDEVEAWSALFSLMGDRAEAESAHPSLDALLGWLEAPRSIVRAERRALEQHVRDCETCRTQVSATRAIEASALVSATTSSMPSESAGWMDSIQSWLADLVPAARAPAMALAALVMVAGIASLITWRQERAEDSADSEPPRYAEQAPSPALDARSAAAQGTSEAAEAQRYAGKATPMPPARSQDSEPAATAAPTGSPPIDPRRSPVEPSASALAHSTPAPAHAHEPPTVEAPLVPVPAPVERAQSLAATTGAEAPATAADAPILLAALVPMEAPLYATSGLPGGTLESLGIQTLVRSHSDGLPSIRALGPEHEGLTASASPVLYWYLSARSDVPIEIVVSAEHAVDPLVEIRLEPPIEQGLHELDLAALNAAFESDVTYRLFVALIPDPSKRFQDVVSGVALRYRPATTAALDETPIQQRAHSLAALGYWYDAFATLSRWIDHEPDAEHLRSHRRALMDQAGVTGVALDRDTAD